jgi:predicted metal-dependent hydrolase
MYLLGIDLFNRGYYWEAHEVWESLWHAAGRHGAIAAFLKGLIQLAVAGVKVRQEMHESAVAHARRAAELFHEAAREAGLTQLMGLELRELAPQAQRLADDMPHGGTDQLPVEIVLPLMLEPKEGGS